MVAETTKRGQWSGDRQRERIFRGAAFRAAGSTALDPQTAGSTVPVRTVALTSEQAVKQDQATASTVSDVQEILSEDVWLRVVAKKGDTERTTHWLGASNVDRCSRP